MTWTLSAPLLLLSAEAVALYLGAARRYDAAHPRRPFPRWRRTAFGTGVLLIAAAFVGPVDRYADAWFSWHMAQHLLVMMAAAPLVLLGAPLLLLRQAGPLRLRRLLDRAVRSRAAQAAQFPIVAWGVYAVVLWGSHYSPLYEAALEHPWVHLLQHLGYLAAALLFWWPVVASESRWRLTHPGRLLYLFAAVPLNAFLALSLYQSARVLYPHYAVLAGLSGRSALADQQAGGAVMWILGGLVSLIAILAVAASWARHDAQVARRIDARTEAVR